MNKNRTSRLAAALVAALLAGPLAAQDPYDLTPGEKSELFLEHLLRFAGAPREKVTELALRYELASALSAEEDAGVDLVGDFIRQAMLETQDRFREAMAAIDAGKDGDAAGILEELAAGRDPYLKAYARFEMAKIHERAGRHVEASAALDRLLRENRMQLIPDDEARFLSARCFETMERDLIAYLEYLLFLVQFPEAPKEMRDEATAKAHALEAKIGKPLTHVASRMDQIGEWLGEEKTSDDPTQKEERELVSALDKFIELAEERERRT
ncbi:MAG: hypothetical protein JXP34_20400 [Planctomycetes bacterium]|nr:hypothetical protein [Planctomycetota bacterium]